MPAERPPGGGQGTAGQAASRVALVHDWLTGMRGGEKCLELLCEMFPRADVYTLVHRRGSVSAGIEAHPIRESWLARLPGGRRYYRALVPLYPRAIESFDLSGYDLVVSTSHCAAKGVLTRADTFHLCYCFTPVRYFWDLYPEYFGPGRGGPLGRLVAPMVAHRFRLWDRLSADRVDRFVAISRHVARRIAKHYRRGADVLHPPVDTRAFTPGPGASSREAAPYLVVSALVPYKGVDLAVLAANRLRVPLRVVGTGPEAARLRRLAGPSVRFDGWLAPEALREAYRGARALLQPHEEDFGIAPLEAMACGTPVIALRRGGGGEVVAPGTGVLFDEGSLAGLIEAVRSFDPRSYDPAVLRARAMEFDGAAWKERMGGLIESAHRAFRRGEEMEVVALRGFEPRFDG
jgi:glycosyltransferase involved in cell wall biosynthesis